MDFVLRILVAVIVGLLVNWIADMFLPDSIGTLLGVLAAIVAYFNTPVPAIRR